MFIDTHCHLASDLLYPQHNLYVDRALSQGIEKIVVPAVNSIEFNRILLLSSGNFIYPALGIHPMYIQNDWVEQINILEQYIQKNHLIAIGEIGLDFSGEISSDGKMQQIEVFLAQIDLANVYHLPVLLHNRASLSLCISLLQQNPVKAGGIAHAFNGSLEQVQILLKQNIKIGLGTMLCRGNTPKLHALAQKLRDEAFVLETDAPDMAPVPHTVNYPENILLLAKTLAEIRHQDLEQIAYISTKNACSVLSF